MHLERTWAYVKNGKLDEFFRDSEGRRRSRVPSRFLREFAASIHGGVLAALVDDYRAAYEHANGIEAADTITFRKSGSWVLVRVGEHGSDIKFSHERLRSAIAALFSREKHIAIQGEPKAHKNI